MIFQLGDVPQRPTRNHTLGIYVVANIAFYSSFLFALIGIVDDVIRFFHVLINFGMFRHLLYDYRV